MDICLEENLHISHFKITSVTNPNPKQIASANFSKYRSGKEQ